MRMILVILAALIVAGGTGFYVMQGLRPAPQPEVRVAAPAPRLQVYVAAQAMRVGTILTLDDLARMPIDDGTLSAEMIVADEAGSATLAGAVARQPLAAGVPIARSAIVQPGERGFLAAVLPRGKRAITINVDEMGSLSGLALPGDRVDVILTYSIGTGDETEEPVRASETVLSNLRVLAFDQRLGPEAKGFDDAPVARTATLEVSPREAEVVTLAQTIGTLSMVLNSVRDDAGDGNVTDATATGATTTATANGGGSKLELTGGPLRPADHRATPPSRLTLASDVTSTARVQVVRGVVNKAAVPSPTTPSAPTAAAAAE